MRTLIIGGGLSGLALAEALERAGEDYLLLEARERVGGRMLSVDQDGASFDLGPSWFWPGQPRIATLIERLGLERFDQFAIGDVLAEDAQGRVRRGQGIASMAGSWRLEGGLAQVPKALAQRLPDGRLRLNAVVTKVAMSDNGVSVTLEDGDCFSGGRIVFALPPRGVGEVDFMPVLPVETLAAMRDVPTWMAGHAKAVAVFDAPIWRNAGLSGDAVSQRGPLVEIHDASPQEGGPFALFGFVGVPPEARRDEVLLKDHIRAQLVRLFGQAPSALILKDWAFDRFTSTTADQAPLYAHPTYRLPDAMRDLWEGRLLFAGTEVAPEFGGYIEGALEAAEIVLDQIGIEVSKWP